MSIEIWDFFCVIFGLPDKNLVKNRQKFIILAIHKQNFNICVLKYHCLTEKVSIM